MAKKSVDYMKFWPLVIALVMAVGGYYTIKNSNASQDVRLDKIEEKQEAQDVENTNILINQAKQGVVLEQVYQLVQEIKEKT